MEFYRPLMDADVAGDLLQINRRSAACSKAKTRFQSSFMLKPTPHDLGFANVTDMMIDWPWVATRFPSSWKYANLKTAIVFALIGITPFISGPIQ